MKRKTTRRALVLSLLSLLLCMSMLVGTTFAWFTDSVTSGKNQIIAGNLDIELQYSKDFENWATVQGAADLIDPNALWEPGHTEVVYLRISNEGTLNLRYQFAINVANSVIGTSVLGNQIRLANYLQYAVIEDVDAAFDDRADARDEADRDFQTLTSYSDQQAMAPGDERTVALVVYMPETVGNEANYRGDAIPTIELGVSVYATQVEAEEDSFGDDYDADALVCDVIATPDTLAAVLAEAEEGDVIGLANQAYYGGVITIPVNKLTLVGNGALVDSIDLNGKKDITIDGLTFDPNYTTIDVSKYDQKTASYVDTGYNANITNTTSTPYGASNIVIRNCTFLAGVEDWGFDPSTYCAIGIEDAGRVSGSTTNLTVENCVFEANSFEHLRLNYIGGDIVIKNNDFLGATVHHNINASGNKGNWFITGNYFSNWGDGEYAFGTSRNGSDMLTLKITDNDFVKSLAVGEEIPVLNIKSSYTAANSVVIVEDNCGNEETATIDTAIRSDYKYYMTGTYHYYSTPCDEAKVALAQDNATVYLGSGEFGQVPTIGKGVTVIGNGETVFAPSDLYADAMSWSVLTDVTFKNVTIRGYSAAKNVTVNGTVTFENCVFDAYVNWVHFDQGAGTSDKLVFDGCNLIGWVTIGGAVEEVEFVDCYFTNNDYQGGLRNYQNATAENCTFEYAEGMVGISPAADCTLTLVDCTGAAIDPDAAGTVVQN